MNQPVNQNQPVASVAPCGQCYRCKLGKKCVLVAPPLAAVAHLQNPYASASGRQAAANRVNQGVKNGKVSR